MVNDKEVKTAVSPFAVRENEVKVFDGKEGFASINQVVFKMDMGYINESHIKALEVVNSSNRYTFNGRSNYSLAINALRKLRKNVQYIFYNAGTLSYDDVRRFNELIALSSFYMNEIVLLQPDEDLATYQTTDRYKVISVDENYKRLNLK